MVVRKGSPVTGAERGKVAAELQKAYRSGKTIRELADAHGRSYGFVHRLLTEQGTEIRPRGGGVRHSVKKGSGARGRG